MVDKIALKRNIKITLIWIMVILTIGIIIFYSIRYYTLDEQVNKRLQKEQEENCLLNIAIEYCENQNSTLGYTCFDCVLSNDFDCKSLRNNQVGEHNFLPEEIEKCKEVYG